MSLTRQAVLALGLIVLAAYVLVAHVPAAAPALQRLGVLDLLGVEAPAGAPEGAGGPRGGGGPATVVVDAVERRAVEDRVTAIGDGRAERSVTVRSEAVGLVTELPVTAGQRVEAGEVVARLDSEAEAIALERAALVLADARADDLRLERLRDRGAVSEVQLREAGLALRTAELGERQARLDLERREVEAPIAGSVGILDVEVGERVAAQDALATITDRSSILIDFRIPERAIGRTELGMPIEVTPLGLRDVTLAGEISAIDTVVDRASRTLRVQGRVGNADDRLRAGMAFSVALTYAGETLMAVDPLALQWSSDGAFVWAVRDGRAERVQVSIRQRDADVVLVEGGLAAGEPVVIEGVQTLRPGAEVRPLGAEDTSRVADAAPTRL